jgi:hypothetical protein
LIIRPIVAAVVFVKENDLRALDDSMTLMGNTRTAVIIFILSCTALPTTVSQLYAQGNRVFSIERPKVGLGAYCRLSDEKRETPNLTTRSTYRRFRESLPLETNGWIYHSNLLDFHLGFEPELQQEYIEQDQPATNPTPSRHRNISILGFDVGATLLKNKPVSLDIFADRKDGQYDFSNAQDSDIGIQTLGTRLNFKNPTLPATVSLMRRKFTRTGFYQSDEERDQVWLKMRHNAKKSVTKLLVLYNNSEMNRTTFESIDTSLETLMTELTNSYFITDDNRIRLDGQLYNMRADYNGLDQRTWILSENLFWEHSKELLTRYRFVYTGRESGGSQNKETRLSAALIHHFRDQLITNLGAAAAFNSFDSGGEDLYRSDLRFNYRRPIPWGRVELGAAWNYGVTNRSGTPRSIPLEERLTLTTGVQTLLDKEDVDLGSIVVTDITGATVYTENVDYQVVTVGPAVSISRTLLGAIADGQQVNVHYSYSSGSAYDDSRFGQRYRFDLALWSSLYLAFSHYRIDQHISGESPNDPLDDKINTLRLSFVKKWSNTYFQYDKQDRSNDNSSVTRTLFERIDLRPARNFFLNLRGKIGDRHFTDLDEEERFYSLGTSVGWTPRSWCNFSLNYARNNISTDQRDELKSEFGVTAKLIYGIWTGTVSYRLRDQDDKQNVNRLWRQDLILQITRRLW